MKTTIITTALAALSVSVSFADHHGHHDDDHHDNHRGGHHTSLAHQTNSKGALLKRLAIAPTYYGCGTSVHALEEAALAAGRVKMLGKVEYGYGKSWLGHSAKHEIEEVILKSGFRCGPNTLIAVLGYADKTGRASVNFRLSETRAKNVRNHINHINWEHNLKLRTVTVAMGEEVELCSHDLGHNRVAEIWLIERPQIINRVVSVVEPVLKHKTVETHVIEAPVQKRVVAVEHAPLPVAQPHIVQAPVATAVLPSSPQVVVQTQAINPLHQLAEFLEHNVMLSPNADPNEFARQLNLLKGLGNNIIIKEN